jgi:hypothetical protein
MKTSKYLIVLFLFCLFCSGLEKRESKYDNGQIKESFLVRKDSEGNYIKEGLYTSWYLNGQKKSEKTYVNGKIEGKSICWFENGQKQEESNFLNDSLDGLQIMWYENGQKKQEGIYKFGSLIGTYKEWDKTGSEKEQWSDAEKKEIIKKFENLKGTKYCGPICYRAALLGCVSENGVDKSALNNLISTAPSDNSCIEIWNNSLDDFFSLDKTIGELRLKKLIQEGYLK